MPIKLQTGNIKTQQITPAEHVKLKAKSINVGALVITDKNSPPGRVVEYKEIAGRGLFLKPSSHAKPLSLLIQMKHYGGNVSTASIDIDW